MPYTVSLKYNLKILWNYIKQQKYLFLLLLFLLLLTEIIIFSENFIFKALMDKASVISSIGKDAFLAALAYLTLLYVIINAIASPILQWFRIKLQNHVQAKLLNQLEIDAFAHVINLSHNFHLHRRTGALISQFTRGVNRVDAQIDTIVYQLFPSAFRIFLSIGVISYLDRVSASVLALMILVYILNGIWNTKRMEHPQKEENKREDDLKQNLSDVFTNIETVKYFAQEEKTGSYFSKMAALLQHARVRMWDTWSAYVCTQTMVTSVGIAILIYVSFRAYMEQRLSLGDITLIYAAVWKLLPQLWELLRGYRDFMRNNADMSALLQIFKEENEVRDTKGAQDLHIREGEVKFQNVSFSYTGKRHALQNFSLMIPAKTRVALVGPSGGGKSTVVKLLYRLFDVQSGAILIDGQDISTVIQHSLRSNLSIVPQEPILFDNSLWFNISYANSHASKDDVWKAVKFAHLDALIRKLPEKENTIVGERGVRLSGGEKQRVSIARAILANRKILILDEATSALDSETEKDIQGYLEQLMKDRTTIVIAHRLSTVMKADMIVVIQEGKIVEMGNHKELSNKKSGLYRRLWELQRGGEL